MFLQFFNQLNAFIFVSTCLSGVSDRKNPKKNLIYSGEEVQKGFREKIHKKISSVSMLNGFIFFLSRKKRLACHSQEKECHFNTAERLL